MTIEPQYLIALIPLTIIGGWRWGTWVVKVVFASRYAPIRGSVPELTTTVVTPVYDEDPDDFMSAVRSWAAGGADEIVAVIDHSDVDCIERYRAYADEHNAAELIVTETPGKRPALRDGTQAASGDIVALVDSDVHWREDTLEHLLVSFNDENVGGVTPKQIVKDRDTLARIIYECQMRLQFAFDYPALAHVSSALSCLSGRTAVYRAEAIQPVIDDLCHETFLKKDVISGDDKFLTRAVQENGWDVWYQSSAVIDIGAAPDMHTLVKQTIRWTRNTIRSDLTSFYEGWVFRGENRWLAYYQLDRFVATFAILLAPLYFIWSLANGWTVVALAVLGWWMLSRTIKISPFLSAYPTRIWVVPVYTLASFFMSPIRLYALFSANTQGWLTRGSDSRYGLNQLRQKAVTGVSVLLTGVTIGMFVFAAISLRYAGQSAVVGDLVTGLGEYWVRELSGVFSVGF
ncbi:glycosyltransferase [Halogeometricum luteum]|uniref:Glycosyltransferase n=1 Tax=Halogeometricum luteum TaxID=2950537 RepID=A0ABU2G3I4_9EURY|nr:glycosyltransferase [Halogeometricum sp. S3BR5-2]MDS0295342.1 glycosyltransferase [Halogeometricum sp. S3BR5-2]